jgi:hypothetical protein
MVSNFQGGTTMNDGMSDELTRIGSAEEIQIAPR